MRTFCFILLLTAGAVAQRPQPDPLAGPQPDGVQARATQRIPTLNDLVSVKVDIRETNTRVIMMIESFRTEKRKARVTVVKPQERAREVPVDGKLVTQIYTVMVPFAEVREVDMDVPAGLKPVTLSTDDVRFFRLSGEAVSIDEVATHHQSLRPMFVIDNSEQAPLSIPKTAINAINPNTYIAVTRQALRKRTDAQFMPVP